MVKFELLQQVGLAIKFSRCVNGAEMPSRMRTRRRTTEKEHLLIQAVRNVYSQYKPKRICIDGKIFLMLPWLD